MSDYLDASKPIEYITLATAVVGLCTGVIGMVLAFKSTRTSQEIKISVDGQLSDFKALIAKSSRAEGVIEGRAEEKAKQS